LWMEDDDDGKQSAAWDIFSSILERAPLGYKEEEKVICISVHLDSTLLTDSR